MGVLDGRVIIEVRCNELTMRDRNPHVPWSPDEIAADAAKCREAGASIVHFHARDARTGAMSGDVGVYADTIRAMRAVSDVLISPTLGASTIADMVDELNRKYAVEKAVGRLKDDGIVTSPS